MNELNTMKAKMQVSNVKNINDDKGNLFGIELEMFPVGDKPYDANGESDDNTYSRWTPSGKLNLAITNSNLFDSFKLGQKFYLEFTKANE